MTRDYSYTNTTMVSNIFESIDHHFQKCLGHFLCATPETRAASRPLEKIIRATASDMETEEVNVQHKTTVK